MKNTLIKILPLAALFCIQYSWWLTAISCNWSTTVAGPNWSETVQVTNGNVSFGWTSYTCNSCFYASHLYVGQNQSNWSDNFTVIGTLPRLMWQHETWFDGEIKNANFTWWSNVSTSNTQFITPTGKTHPFWNVLNLPGDPYDGKIFGRFEPGDTALTYITSTGGVSLNTVGSGALPSMRSTPGFSVSFNAASHARTGTNQQGPMENHVQCAFIFPRWCGDGKKDTDKNEQCDDGNQANGDGCSATCQTEVVQPPICTGLTIAPATLTSSGGTITATCSGTNVSQYKLVLKEGSTVINTIDYQNSNVGIFTLPWNTTAASKNYSVQCFVKSGTTTDITDNNLCLKTLSVPGTNPQCESLTITPTSLTNGGTVNFNCTGINNPTSFEVIFKNPNNSVMQIFTTSSGSITIPATPLGTYTAECRVNGQALLAACTKQLSNTTVNVPNPAIRIIKDDNDNHDDTQQINPPGNSAQFTVVVSNPGPETLENLNITDPYAPECNRSIPQTRGMIINVGNRDERLDPGESFSYICIRPNVGLNTFPNNENQVCVVGQGSTSGISVNSCDNTGITFVPVNNICQYMNIQKNGDRYNVNCGPSGSFKLFVLKDRQVINSYQSLNGIFDISLPNDNGEYRFMCIRDGEQSVQPQCQKNIVINPREDVCVLESSISYGGAPINVNMNCITPSFAQCSIRVTKDGEPWKTISDCQASFLFEEKGTYDAVCVVGDADIRECSTRVQIDVMTDIPTGPFLPILIVIALSTAGYITYRRRKTV